MRFYFKTTSKIVLTLLFLTKKTEGAWSSITREETFRKFYQNIPYPNPIDPLHDLITWSTFGKHENSSIVLTQAEREY